MEVVCLENIWKNELTATGWSSRAVAQPPLCIATSTCELFKNWDSFLRLLKFHIPCNNLVCLQIFFGRLLMNRKPLVHRLKLLWQLVHICMHYAAYGLQWILDNYQLQLLVSALKSATDAGQLLCQSSRQDLFMTWKDSDKLNNKTLWCWYCNYMVLVTVTPPPQPIAIS